MKRSRFLLPLLTVALTLTGCTTPAAPAPLPARDPGRSVLFAFSGTTATGAPLTRDEVTFVLSGLTADGLIQHRDDTTGQWIPGPDIRPTMPFPFKFRAKLTNHIIQASGSVDVLGNPGDSVECTATDEATGRLVDQKTASIARNATKGGLHPLIVVCTA